MKKTISMLLALVMCLSLCACGGGNDAPATETPTTEAPTTAVLDKNDSANYIGEWETEFYRLIITKGGVGKYGEVSKDHGYYDLDWEVKDEVLITQISFFGMEHKAVLELNEDGTMLTAIQMGFPSYREGETEFAKK